MTREFTAASLGILLSATAFGQPSTNARKPLPAAGVKFEVDSVKPVLNWPPVSSAPGERRAAGTSGSCPTSMKIDVAQVDLRCTTLAMLIGYAFRLSPDRVTGPDWMMAVGSPRFDIVAKMPQGGTKDQVPEMLQAMLAERFKLIIHREIANQPVYTLTVGKGGLRMKAAPPGIGAVASTDPNAPLNLDGFYGNTQSRTFPDANGEMVTIISNPRMGEVRQTGDRYKLQRWEAANISLAGLADLLDQAAPLSLPVIDMTGLKGRYQLALEVSLRSSSGAQDRIPGTATGDTRADIGEALLEGFNLGLLKLGLRLESRKGPLETLVIDHVEKLPTQN